MNTNGQEKLFLCIGSMRYRVFVQDLSGPNWAPVITAVVEACERGPTAQIYLVLSAALFLCTGSGPLGTRGL